MNILQEIQELSVKKLPNIKVGSTVSVHQRIKEGGKERVQIFEGLVIKTNSGHGADKSITVRKIIDGIGVEKIFPLYSPNIVKIMPKKESKIRRAKLYYMRKRSGKSARLKENFVDNSEFEAEVVALAEAEEKKKASAEAQSEAEGGAPSVEAQDAEQPQKDAAPAPQDAEPAPAEAPAEEPKEEKKEE
jgi:large subunit ribosomal protein L19